MEKVGSGCVFEATFTAFGDGGAESAGYDNLEERLD